MGLLFGLVIDACWIIKINFFLIFCFTCEVLECRFSFPCPMLVSYPLSVEKSNGSSWIISCHHLSIFILVSIFFFYNYFNQYFILYITLQVSRGFLFMRESFAFLELMLAACLVLFALWKRILSISPSPIFYLLNRSLKLKHCFLVSLSLSPIFLPFFFFFIYIVIYSFTFFLLSLLIYACLMEKLFVFKMSDNLIWKGFSF